MKFGLHNPSRLFGADPSEIFPRVTTRIRLATLASSVAYRYPAHLVETEFRQVRLGISSAPGVVRISRMEETARFGAEPGAAGFSFVGTASQATDLAGRYRDAGVQVFISSALRNDADTLELLATDVLPHFA